MNRLRQRLHPNGDDGTTLVETIVAILIMSVLGAIILAATIATQRSLRVSDNETTGQNDVALAVDLLSRDIRSARGVVCDQVAPDTTCQAHLQLWIDANSNYKQDSGETVTWRLRLASDNVHYDLVRETDGGNSKTAATTIVQNVAFAYDTQPKTTQPAPGQPTTRVVSVKMFYNANPSAGTGTRTVAFSTLLRNVP
jgi:Tfp pilus assembly protein PilW